MSKNTPTLLKTAAELRSNGASWAAVGRSVGRSPRTCQQWPRLFRPAWDSLYQDAEGRRFTETGGEATAVLQRLLRDGDNRTKLRSADVLLRTRHQRSMLKPSPAAPLSAADTAALKLGRRFQAEAALEERKPVLQCSADNLPPAAANDPNDVVLCDSIKLHSDVAAHAEPDPAALPTPAAACPAPSNASNGSLRGMVFGVLILIATLLLTALSQQPSNASGRFDSLEKEAREPARYRAIPLGILFEKRVRSLQIEGCQSGRWALAAFDVADKNDAADKKASLTPPTKVGGRPYGSTLAKSRSSTFVGRVIVRRHIAPRDDSSRGA